MENKKSNNENLFCLTKMFLWVVSLVQKYGQNQCIYEFCVYLAQKPNAHLHHLQAGEN